ncbi:anti-sigma factor antagonist [Mycolicibacter terrae]|uniref:Anti-anti-sigma factor n=2 Tax=Mycolicibacter TaxID=1073531 RepID=A0A1A2NTI4_MYCSD|nr:anti-anti-sigma factor [Mycolicibacter sinensis]OBI29384.1 anti-anti-sigma factor [Mycolicibacter sinensis]RRR48746.1 anti-sigma factor antagonist [Mycolicibacter terrae]
MISLDGELDASNADELAGYVQRCAGYCEWLVLDLNDLEFIGTAGFSVLKAITSRCADAMVYCTTVPGPAVTRLLRICDPTNALPTTSSVADALAGVQGFRPVS